jgi:hypothetical protein
VAEKNARHKSTSKNRRDKDWFTVGENRFLWRMRRSGGISDAIILSDRLPPRNGKNKRPLIGDCERNCVCVASSCVVLAYLPIASFEMQY